MTDDGNSVENVDTTSLCSCEPPLVPLSGFFDDSEDDMPYDGCDEVLMMAMIMYFYYDSAKFVPFSGFFDDSEYDMSYDDCDDVLMMAVMMYLYYVSDHEESASEDESEVEHE